MNVAENKKNKKILKKTFKSTRQDRKVIWAVSLPSWKIHTGYKLLNG